MNYPNLNWSPELAYAVGLLTTDGNLSKDGRHITMRSTDLDLIQTFNQCLKINNKISINNSSAFRKPCYRVQPSNVKLYRWLIKKGLFPNKSLTIGSIKIPSRYFRDFLRGHLDGDGSIITYIDKYNHYRSRVYTNHRLWVIFISASRKHIEWISKQIKLLTKLKGSIIERPTHNKNRVSMWSLKFSKKESISLLKWIYYKPNLPCLQRKFLHAQEVLNTIPFEKRKIYEKISKLQA